MITEYTELLERHGWMLEHDSPIAIRHHDKGFVSGDYVWNVIHDLNDLEREKREEMVAYRVCTQLREHGSERDITADDILILTGNLPLNNRFIKALLPKLLGAILLYRGLLVGIRSVAFNFKEPKPLFKSSKRFLVSLVPNLFCPLASPYKKNPNSSVSSS